MFIRVGFTVAILLALVDIQTIFSPGSAPLAVDVAGLILGVLTLLGVLGHRRAPLAAVVLVIVCRVLSAVLAVGGLIAAGRVPSIVRWELWAFLALSAVAVAVLTRGLTQRNHAHV